MYYDDEEKNLMVKNTVLFLFFDLEIVFSLCFYGKILNIGFYTWIRCQSRFFFFFKFLYLTRHKISNTLLIYILHLDSITCQSMYNIRKTELQK